MKNYKLILAVAIMALASCNQNVRTAENSNAKPDSVAAQANQQYEEEVLIAKMQIADTIKISDSIPLKFTVYNHADSVKQFCKWHTPFEPLMSKYLEIKDENGNEVSYQGPMAKRMMPPPASSYLKVNPGDSLSIDIDLLKAYAIKKPARYTIKYTGQNISGLVVKDSVSFVWP